MIAIIFDWVVVRDRVTTNNKIPQCDTLYYLTQKRKI